MKLTDQFAKQNGVVKLSCSLTNNRLSVRMVRKSDYVVWTTDVSSTFKSITIDAPSISYEPRHIFDILRAYVDGKIAASQQVNWHDHHENEAEFVVCDRVGKWIINTIIPMHRETVDENIRTMKRLKYERNDIADKISKLSIKLVETDVKLGELITNATSK